MISFNPQVMGVLNLTPDSFSDGGRFFHSEGIKVSSVVDAAAAMVAEGAHWLDIGGESTRPGAQPVSEQEELDRVLPALEALSGRFDTALSVDTSSPDLMKEAAKLGASMINDVRALQREGALEAVVDSNMAVCLMHMRGDPDSMQSKPSYESVVEEVQAFLADALNRATAAGIAEERICLDPGFGFGKTLAHNMQLLQGIDRLTNLRRPILVGFSRKSMIGKITGRDVDQRDIGTTALNMLALKSGASILRVHDVAAAIDVVKIWQSFLEAQA